MGETRMKSVSRDARGFVEGVVNHLKKSEKAAFAPKVQSLLVKMTEAAKREHSARIESVVRLTNTEMQSIASALAHVSGHNVTVTNVINPSLIGGLRITMSDWVMDMSFTHELRNMASLVVS